MPQEEKKRSGEAKPAAKLNPSFVFTDKPAGTQEKGNTPVFSFEPEVKDELERFKSDIKAKKDMLDKMIEGIKPLETEIDNRISAIDYLKKEIGEKEKSIAAMSSDNKALKDSNSALTVENTRLKSSVAEKDGLLKVTKDRLAEKTNQLKDAEDRIGRLSQEVDSYKKQLFSLNNRIGAIESRIHSTDEQNQKLLYELMRYKELQKHFDAQLSEKGRIIESMKAEQSLALDSVLKDEEEKRVLLMKSHSKKITLLSAALDSLKTKLEQQNRIIDDNTARETAIIAEFSRKMSDLLANKPSFSAEIPKFDDADAAVSAQDPLPRFSAPKQPEFDFGRDSGPSKVDEIVPMVELAMDHGDSVERIRHSLESSGYSRKDIEEALSKANIAVQK
jgi:DNA repair exonuclease SbcCD ATPase subunit